jgi:hypothetical protein
VTNTNSTEGCCSWDISVEVFDHGVLSLTLNHKFLIHELSSNVSGARTGDIDPNSGEESTGGQDEDRVDDRMDWVLLNVI